MRILGVYLCRFYYLAVVLKFLPKNGVLCFIELLFALLTSLK